MGPAVVVSVGVLFLLDQLRGGYLSFGNTFPVILIVLGVISLASNLAPVDGHISGPVTATPPGTTPPQNPSASQGQGSGR
jgi:hypothetical protein